jgi:hypothetical protein
MVGKEISQPIHTESGRLQETFLRKKLSLFTAEVVTDALPDLLRSQEPSRFDNRTLAMDPLRLN